jgi:hypothetical protein
MDSNINFQWILEQGTAVELCEHGNKQLGSAKWGLFLPSE